MTTGEHRRAPGSTQPFLHIPVPWVFVLGYLIGIGLQLLAPAHAGSAQLPTVLPVAGAVLFVVGAGIAGWSLILFARARTTTVPGEPSKILMTRGPYRFTRNPMYVGLVLAYLGEAGMLLQIWPLVPLLFAVAYVNWFVIPVEERSLGQMFAERYSQYCARVRRWI
jgi:protein-S-isoprenylcysteine O-methyltransferase Ste14